MHLEFLDEGLRRLLDEPGYRPAGWSDAEIEHFCLVVQCADAARVHTDLLNMRLLGLQTDPHGAPDASWTRLGPHRQLTVTFKSGSSPMTAVFDLSAAETAARS